MARRYAPDGSLSPAGPPWARTPILLFGALAFIVLGLMVLPQTLGQMSDLAQLRDGQGVTTRGTVVDAIKQDGGRFSVIGQPRQYSYCPLYRFEKADGTIDHLEASSGCASDPAEVTEPVDIIYDPADPSAVYVDSTAPLVGGLVMGGFSLVAGLGMIATFVVVRIARSRLRAQHSGPTAPAPTTCSV